MATKPKSSSGKKTAFTAQEISEIIRECKQQGVSKLTVGDLHLVFEPQARTMIVPEVSVETKPPEAAISEQDQSKQAVEATEQEELEFRDRQIDEMLIENPLEAERLIAEGELVIDESESEQQWKQTSR